MDISKTPGIDALRYKTTNGLWDEDFSFPDGWPMPSDGRSRIYIRSDAELESRIAIEQLHDKEACLGCDVSEPTIEQVIERLKNEGAEHVSFD